LLRAAGTAFGHRLMLDRVVPGGVAADLGRDGPAALHEALAAVAAALPELEDAGENHGGLRDRLVGRVVTPPALAARVGAGGPVGRAGGRGLDARRLPGGGGDSWAAALGLRVPVLAAGDAAARQGVLLAELRASVALAEALLDGMPPGAVVVPWPQRGGEGVGVVEGPRGMCLHWLALDDDGQIRGAFALDPAWGHWPLLAAAMAGQPVRSCRWRSGACCAPPQGWTCSTPRDRTGRSPKFGAAGLGRRGPRQSGRNRRDAHPAVRRPARSQQGTEGIPAGCASSPEMHNSSWTPVGSGRPLPPSRPRGHGFGRARRSSSSRSAQPTCWR
jgi:hypothetical protein